MTYPELPLHIDSTMMSCARSCLQKFFREFVEGYRPAGISIDLHAGGCFASALEETYKQVFLKQSGLPSDTDLDTLLELVLETCRRRPHRALDAAVHELLELATQH